jgi:hypothetical protein
MYSYKGLSLPEDITTIICRFAFEPSRIAKIVKGINRVLIADQSRFVLSHNNVQMQIQFCPHCGNYNPWFMHQELYSHRAICICDNNIYNF